MTLKTIMKTIITTTHSNTREMRNTPATTMKKKYMDHLNTIMKTIVVSMKKRMKVYYVKKMRPTHSLMTVWNNDMRTNLSKFT
jgi:hypothetical protein